MCCCFLWFSLVRVCLLKLPLMTPIFKCTCNPGNPTFATGTQSSQPTTCAEAEIEAEAASVRPETSPTEAEADVIAEAIAADVQATTFLYKLLCSSWGLAGSC